MKVRDLLPDINYLDAGLTEEDLSLFGFDAMVITEGEKELEKELNALIESPSDIYDNIQSEDKKVSASKKEQAELKKEIEQNQIIANQMQDAQYQANKERMQQVKQEVKTKAAGKAMESEAYVMLAFDNVDNKERFMHTFGFVETDKVIKGEILMKVAKHV